MAETTFNTPDGQTIAREKLVAYMNTGTGELPVWSPVGIRVPDSSMENDWQRDTSKDIMGNSYSNMKKPIVTQTFDPWPITKGDSAVEKIWNMAVKDQDAEALAAVDMLIVHLYAGTADTAMFAERYSACAIEVTGLGGEGGGNLSMPVSVTYGGTRTTGTAKVAEGAVTFTPDVA